MASNAASDRPIARARVKAPDVQELPDYCARPACRRTFIRVVGPGRPQAFCSEVCRRSAERELRQTRSRLAHFERLAEQLRTDVAAFGGAAIDDADQATSPEARRVAEAAVNRVAGVLAFLSDSTDPLARELQHLHEAVAPVIMTGDLR